MPQQERESLAVIQRSCARIPIGRAGQDDSGVGVVLAREVVHAVPIEGARIAGANDHLVAGQQPGESRLSSHCPGGTNARRKVVGVGVVGRRALSEVDERRHLAGLNARLEQVTGALRVHAGHATEVVDRAGRVAAVQRSEGELQLVAQAGVDRQVGACSPRILDEETRLAHARTLRPHSHVLVLVRAFIQPDVAVDAADPPDQERVQILGGGQVGIRRPGEVCRR